MIFVFSRSPIGRFINYGPLYKRIWRNFTSLVPTTVSVLRISDGGKGIAPLTEKVSQVFYTLLVN